jgi:flagellar protein FliS
MRQYERQAIATATPEQLVAKLYDLGIAACHRGDRSKLRAVLVELAGSLDMEAGGDLAGRLYAIYEFCLRESAVGDLAPIGDILGGLREAWHDGVLATRAAA